jgi:hypothetical protein
MAAQRLSSPGFTDASQAAAAAAAAAAVLIAHSFTNLQAQTDFVWLQSGVCRRQRKEEK